MIEQKDICPSRFPTEMQCSEKKNLLFRDKCFSETYSCSTPGPSPQLEIILQATKQYHKWCLQSLRLDKLEKIKSINTYF